jgi:hypothetical protein
LKSFGVPGHPVEDDWKSHRSGLLTWVATFPRRSGVRTGDRLAYYAVGLVIVFAVYEAVSLPYQEDPSDPWGWYVKVKPIIDLDFVHDGVPLEYLNVNGRDLRRSIRQHSAIHLAEIEGKAALAEIGKRL